MNIDSAAWLYVMFWFLVFASPFWVPITFFAYALGQRRFSVAFWLLFAVVEAAAITFAINASN